MAHLLALIRGLGLILLDASGTLGLLARHSSALLLLLSATNQPRIMPCGFEAEQDKLAPTSV